jgi:AMIN domain
MGNPDKLTMRLSRTSRPNLRYCLSAAGISAIATLLLLVSIELNAEPSNTRLAILSGIRYNQTNRSVSIVLHLNDHRPFTLGRLKSGLYVDIEDTRLSPELMASGVQLPSDSLVQVKTRQLRKDTARVIFHFDTIASLQAVPLSDPARILVEIDLPDQSTETGDSLSASATSPTSNTK